MDMKMWLFWVVTVRVGDFASPALDFLVPLVGK